MEADDVWQYEAACEIWPGTRLGDRSVTLLPPSGKPVKKDGLLLQRSSSAARPGDPTLIEGYRRCCGTDIHKDTVVVCVPRLNRFSYHSGMLR